MLARQPRYLVSHGLRVLLREIGASAGVQPLVPGQFFRPFVREALEEVLTCSGFEEEEIRPDAGRAGRPRGADDLRELGWAIRYARQDRGHADTCGDSRLHELATRSPPLAGLRSRGPPLPPAARTSAPPSRYRPSTKPSGGSRSPRRLTHASA